MSALHKLAVEFRILQEKEFAFRERISAVSDDILALADLLAEASRHERSMRADSVVGRDGRARFTPSQLFACYMVDAAESAYSMARALSNG